MCHEWLMPLPRGHLFNCLTHVMSLDKWPTSTGQSGLLFQPPFVGSTLCVGQGSQPILTDPPAAAPFSVSPEEPRTYKAPTSPHPISMSSTQTQPASKRPRSASTLSNTEENASEWKEVSRKRKAPRRTEQMPSAPQTSFPSNAPDTQAPQPVSATPSQLT